MKGQELEIDFTYPTQYTKDVSQKMSFGKSFGLIVFVLFFALVTIGGCIQICPCGNRDIYDAEQVEKASIFRTSEQFEAVSLAKKNSWAQGLMSLSIIRNTNKMNLG